MSAEGFYGMILLSISAGAKPGKRNELLNAYRLITAKTRQERGCLRCRISQDIDNENIIYLEETWSRRSYLEAYFRSDIFSALLGGVEMLSETHEIQIKDGYQTDGAEAIQAARSKKGD